MSEGTEKPLGGLLDGLAPGGLVYGVLAVTTVIAAEGTRQETFTSLVEASLLTMALYWVAHAYSRHWAARLEKTGSWSLGEITTSLAHESSILLGAVVPVITLLAAWAAGATIETAVTAALWAGGVEMALLEMLPGILRRLPAKELLAEAATGAVMGGGILLLRVVLH